MTIGWKEWQASRAQKRAILEKYGLAAPSRKRTSFNTAERFMRKAFDGKRIPDFAMEKAE